MKEERKKATNFLPPPPRMGGKKFGSYPDYPRRGEIGDWRGKQNDAPRQKGGERGEKEAARTMRKIKEGVGP